MTDIELVLNEFVNYELMMRCRETGELSNVKEWEHKTIEDALIFQRENTSLKQSLAETQAKLDKAVELLDTFMDASINGNRGVSRLFMRHGNDIEGQEEYRKFMSKACEFIKELKGE